MVKNRQQEKAQKDIQKKDNNKGNDGNERTCEQYENDFYKKQESVRKDKINSTAQTVLLFSSY
jgi:hypothetical protein